MDVKYAVSFVSIQSDAICREAVLVISSLHYRNSLEGFVNMS